MQTNRMNTPLCLIAASLLAFSCSHPKPNEDAESTRALDSLVANSNLTEVKELPVTNTLDLAGKISMDENRSARIFPLAGGIVVSVAVELGDYVKKGQIMATIKSPELIDAQRDFKNDEAELLNQEKNVEAAKELSKSGLMSEKEYQITFNQLQIARNNVQKSREILGIYHQGEKADEFNIYAPVSGYVIEKNISPNTQFQASQTESLFSVSDLNEIYADAEVYQSDINKVNLNDSIYISTLANPGKIYRGVITKLMNVLDPVTKTMKVRARIANNVDLKPEMFAQMSVNYQAGKILPAIPKSAIVFDNSLNYVVVKTATGVEVKKVDIEATNKLYAFISTGLQPGNKVATKDALLIYNALNN